MKKKKTLVLFLVILAAFAAFAQPEFGIASFYGSEFHGRPTASGQIYSQNKLTAAHKTLPLGTVVKVTNTKNNKSVFVTVNDRGPYVKGRIIDLSTKAAEVLGYRNKGTAYVKVEVVNPNETPVDPTAPTPQDIASTNGIREYASIDSQDAWKDVPTITQKATEDSKDDMVESTPIAYTDKKDLPPPAGEIKPTNSGAIMNRSAYYVITNLDKSKTGFYGLQLGVFSDPNVVFSMMDELEKYKQILLIQQETKDGKTVYKLFMGKFQNRAYADALFSVLSDKFKEAFVTQYE